MKRKNVSKMLTVVKPEPLSFPDNASFYLDQIAQ